MNKNFKHIEDFYKIDSDFRNSFKSTPFDFYLDFIGYTTDRNLKEEDYIKKHKKQNSLTNLDTIGLWKHQVLEADQVFGHRERVAFGLALMIFEDVGYEDVYKFIDNLLKEKKEN